MPPGNQRGKRERGSLVISIAAIDDNQMFIDGLRIWTEVLTPDIRLAAVVSTVGELLQARSRLPGVVLLSAALPRGPDPAFNVHMLISAGQRVVVIDDTPDRSLVAASLAAGAHGCLSRDHDMAALIDAVRSAASGTASSSEAGSVPHQPRLSNREHDVLTGYASGLTLDVVARKLGISPGTARTYLKRIKAKYQQAGLSVYTKLDLAEQVRATARMSPEQRT